MIAKKIVKLLIGCFQPGALHPVPPAPIKALPCLCIFPPMAVKSKPPALRVVGGSCCIFKLYFAPVYNVLFLKKCTEA